MNAVHLEDGKVDIRRVPVPSPEPGFALIRLIVGGICNTDLELRRGYYAFSGTPGHEFVGEVVNTADPSLAGRRVAGEINLACGACDWCRRGLGRHCPSRTVLGIAGHRGAFSEYFTLPERNLHVIPDDLPSEHAVFAEPVAAACEILDQVHLPQKREVAVLGDGKLGLLVAQVLHLHGSDVHLYGRHAGKLRIAYDSGIRTFVTEDVPAALYDWVVEATGTPEGLRQAVRMTRPRGTVILKSTVHGSVPADTADIIVREITLVGSRCGRFEPALELLSSGLLHVGEMISDRFALTEAPRAFDRAAEPGVLKVLLQA